MIFLIVFFAVLLLLLIGSVVVREVRLHRRARDDNPATLEGGGSHLSRRD
jgi:hypothetical protein